MKHYLYILLCFTFLLSGCNQESIGSKNGSKKVIASLFPQYDFARQIAKDKVEVQLLLPPGVEPHSYEPTPRDIVEITRSAIFVYTGDHMEPWAEKIIRQSKGKSLLILDASNGIELMSPKEHEHNHDCSSCSHDSKDPHIWLDPVLAQKMVENILQGFVHVFPQHKDSFEENARAYKSQLENLHQKNLKTFLKAKRKKILYGGHFAFGYFAQRYGLEHISPYQGFSPNAEPTPGRILDLLKAMKDSQTDTIYYEELLDPKIARVLAEQTGCQILPLHAAHNVSREDRQAGITYIQIMEENLKRLKEGLGYDE